MARPQSPELRRPANTVAFEPDVVASRLDAHPNPTGDGRTGPVPESNRPGHRPERDQDQPDLDAFAARFSGADGEGAAAVAAEPTSVTAAARLWAAAVAAAAVALAAVLIWRRRR